MAKKQTVADALRAIAAERALTVKIDGNCMSPLLESGARVTLTQRKFYFPGDCLVFAGAGGKLCAHRLLGYYFKKGEWRYLTQADHAVHPDRYFLRRQIVGRISGGECDSRLAMVPLLHRRRALMRFFRLVLAKFPF